MKPRSLPAFIRIRHCDTLEDPPEDAADPEPLVARSRKYRVIGDLVLYAKLTEPAVGKVHLHLATQQPLGGKAKNIVDDQHPQHQHGVSDSTAQEQRKSNEMIGAELGYRYVNSPIICDIPGGPEHLFRTYEPTTWPGARLPHVWLDDGTAIQDCIPTDGFTILKFGPGAIDTASLESAIRARSAPIYTFEVRDQIARDVYGYDAVLLRPDLHIVWRGNAITDAAELAAIATGYFTR